MWNDLACLISLNRLLLAALPSVEGQITILLFMSEFPIIVTEFVLCCLWEQRQGKAQSRNQCYLWRKRFHCELEHLKCTYPSSESWQSEQTYKWNCWVSIIPDKATQRQLGSVRKNVSVLSTWVGASSYPQRKWGYVYHQFKVLTLLSANFDGATGDVGPVPQCTTSFGIWSIFLYVSSKDSSQQNSRNNVLPYLR